MKIAAHVDVLNDLQPVTAVTSVDRRAGSSGTYVSASFQVHLGLELPLCTAIVDVSDMMCPSLTSVAFT